MKNNIKSNPIMLRLKWFLLRFLKVREYGFSYLWNKQYRELIRRRIKNRKKTLKNRVTYGSFWCQERNQRIHRLFYRDGNKCFWCSKSLKFEEATIDHIKPVSQGRDNRLSNLRLIHGECRVDRDKLIEQGILKLK